MYRHTQAGTVIRRAMLGGIGLTVGAVFLVPDGPAARPARVIGITTAVALLGALVIFGSLTITVEEGRLGWSFGPGVLRGSVPVATIAEASPVRTTVLEGWGVHLTRRGWLYNVSGFDAVWVRLASGKQFLLGTDEPAELVAAIIAARSAGHS